MESSQTVFPEALPDRPPQGFFPFVWHYARPFRGIIAANAAAAACVALIEVWIFSFVGNLVDWLSGAERESFLQTYWPELLGMSAVVLILYPLSHLVSEVISNQGVLGNFAMRTRWQAHRYLLRQSVGFFQNDYAGRVAAKMMQTSLGVRDAVLKTTEILLYVGIYFLAAVALFAAADWRLAMPMLAWLAAYAVILRFLVPKMAALSEAQAEARSMVTGRVVDGYTNITTVKMFAHADAEDGFVREGMSQMLGAVYRSMRLATWMMFLMTAINAALFFAVCGIAIWLWQFNLVSLGALAFATGLVLRIHGMAHWILWEVSSLFENIGIVQDGIGTISRDRAVTDRPGAAPLKVSDGHVRFEGIRFNYGKSIGLDGDRVIEKLDLDVKPGEKIGVVGRSGAGKSTLVNLLLRFYDLEGGRITIDGQDIAGVSQDSLRSAIGMVTQDTSLLHRSVADNISYGSPDAKMEDVVAAATRAEAHDFIRGLSDPHGRTGYDAHVGERGVKLSGGQRQRIAIARVLLKNAPILVLDEATSALDSEVEAAIQQNLYRLMEGKTVIAIAHRLSTIAAMDRLVVMDGGKIVEEGTHDILIQKGGLYADLWSRQSGGFLLGEAAE
ncbi:MAG: ABC transporter ATP-binding protein [Minwuia sp.]|uniref:ABC transporter ATP-binding protein n=1 Tax=Minwuia sp. TaxID=2493630 RepID=UPI003A85309C